MHTTVDASSPARRVVPPTATARPGAAAPPAVDIVVPVLDEQAVLRASVERLVEHLQRRFPFTWRVTVVDNGSRDATPRIAAQLAAEIPGVRFVRLQRRGRGLALRSAWSASDATVVAYTDVDLSTDLDALLPLVAPLLSGHSDLAIGSRLSTGSSVARGPRRELISRTYNLILRTTFATGFHDAQCGFKAVRADAARALLPEVEDDGWFFDTELLLLAEHHGLRIHEVPVDWVDDPDSRVDVRRTAVEDLKGVARMARRFLAGTPELAYQRPTVFDDLGRARVSFLTIGVTSTLVSLAVFLALRGTIGDLAANAVALSLTAGANAWANRRFTLGRRGAGGRRRHYRHAAAVYLGTLVVSSAVLVALQAIGADPALEAASLVVIWVAAGVLRFRHLLGDPPPPPRPPDAPGASLPHTQGTSPA
jgi:glycosyltransferase involved in cell wall biosynthesis